MLQLLSVATSRPSSVSATRSSSVPRAGFERDVDHADDRRPVPAVGAHRSRRRAPQGGGGLAAREVVDEEALLDERSLAGDDALVVPAEGAVAAGARRVGDERDERRPVAELAEHPRLHERAAGEGDLAAEGAIELGRVAARLVDLEADLARLEQERARSDRAGRGGEEREDLFAHAVDVAAEVERPDPLPARLEAVAALPGRVAPALRDAVVADREDVHPARAVRERLRDVGALGGDEALLLPRPVHPRLGALQARIALAKRAHRGVEHRELLLDGDRERVDRDGRLVGAGGCRLLGEGDRSACDGGRGARDRERAARGRQEAAFTRVGGAREPPCLREHADADAAGCLDGHLLGAAVAHAQALTAVVDQPHLRVAHVRLRTEPRKSRVEGGVGGHGRAR